jgi:hypothetical protein
MNSKFLDYLANNEGRKQLNLMMNRKKVMEDLISYKTIDRIEKALDTHEREIEENLSLSNLDLLSPPRKLTV